MKLIVAIYDRIPTTALVVVLLSILAAAYLVDRADNARYRNEHCKYLQQHGWPDSKCSAS